ncbi:MULTISPECIES: LbtU family siderophore porin [Deferrisoma]
MRCRALCLCAILALPPALSPAATLEERVEALEKRNAELYHTLEEKKAAGVGTRIGDRLSLSGLLEVEASYERRDARSGDDEAASDLVLATAQLGFEAAIHENLSATLVLLYEEDETEGVEVDEATLDYRRGAWFGRFGRQYVPFGAFPSHFVSDPLTLELGETRETAVLIGYDHDRFTLSLFAMNGDAEKVNAAGQAEEDHVKDWGVSAVLRPLDGVELGASLLSDLADTDADLLPEYRDRVAGWSAYAVIAAGPFELSGELLGSLGAFDRADLDEDADGSGDRPLTWNLEAAWDVRPTVEVAARLAGSRDLAGFPRLQTGAVVSWSPWEQVSLALEYLHAAFDEDFEPETDSADTLTAQLAVEF